MLGRMSKFVPPEQKTSIIEIIGYQDKNLEGTLQNPYYQERKAFSNLTQLLFLMENLQDDLHYPQKGMETRSFTGDTSTPLQFPETDLPSAQVKATFKLRVLFRQNASWQGTITWVEEGVEAQFRSALELVFLIDSVLN